RRKGGSQLAGPAGHKAPGDPPAYPEPWHKADVEVAVSSVLVATSRVAVVEVGLERVVDESAGGVAARPASVDAPGVALVTSVRTPSGGGCLRGGCGFVAVEAHWHQHTEAPVLVAAGHARVQAVR